MNRTATRILAAVLTSSLLLILGAAAALAADDIGQAGSGPDNPLAPRSEWLTLADNAKHWYAFKEDGDQEDVFVRMDVEPADRAIFEVWTSEQLRQWRNGEKFEPVGAGTENQHLNDDLYWTGNFVASDTYYVVVTSRNFGPADYHLTINGKNVSFPSTTQTALTAEAAMMSDSPTMEADATAATLDETEVMEESAALTVEPALGTHAGVARAPVGETVQIQAGETQWYKFRDEGDQATIEAALDADPNIGVVFEVWTPEQLRLWQNGDEFDPVGAGTENTALDIDRFWSGSFVRSGNYYLVVRHSGLIDGPVEYSLMVSGDDVSY